MNIDSGLISKCINNDRRAHNALYKKLFGYLMNICVRYKMNYDDAGSALNAIFLKIVLGLSDYQEGRPFLPWVKTIAIRHLIDEHRKEVARKERVVFDNEEIRDEDYALLPSGDLNAQDLLRMVRQLPESCGKVFNLHAIDGFKHAEICEMLQINENTSRWYLSEARKKLRNMIELERTRLGKTKITA